MDRYKTVCQWCPRLYTSAGAYSNHSAKVHPEKSLADLQKPKSRKRRISNVTDTLESSSVPNINELDLAEIISGKVDFSDTYHSEGSDREAREFSSESESESESKSKSESESNEVDQQVDVIKHPHAGNPIRQHVFLEHDVNFNLFT